MRGNLRVYVGAYTSDFGTVSGKGRGIALYDLDPIFGSMTKLSEVAAENPSYLALHPTGRFLYATNEEAHASSSPDNAISAFAIAADGHLTPLNQQPSLGGAPCFVAVTPDGRFVLTANYVGGNVVMYPIAADGRLAAPSDNVHHGGTRDRVAHAHSINIAPGGRYALACDLGLDQIFVYEIDLAHGKLPLHAVIDLPPGSGPRHLTFHPDGRTAYVINELNATMAVLMWDGMTGALAVTQIISTIPADYAGISWAADVHVHPNGRFVYGSNRTHDSIVIYAVDRARGRLTLVGHEGTRGQTPRNLALAPDGELLLAANQDSGTVVVFQIDGTTGRLIHLATNDIPTPVCLKFA